MILNIQGLLVSGLHVGLVLFVFFVFFRTLGLFFGLTSLLVIPLLAYYAVLAGLRPPVGQATLMAEMKLDFLPYVFKISTSYAQVKK
jgi:hypothetical protein